MNSEVVEVAMRNGVVFRLNRHRLVELTRRDVDGEGRALPGFVRWNPKNEFVPVALTSLNREAISFVRSKGEKGG